MSNFIRAVATGFLRALLPFSFLIAVIFDPITMLSRPRELPDVIRYMWDDCRM